jgi:hypothetical protein
MPEEATGGDSFRRVNGILSDVDVLDDALLIHDERCTLSQLVAGAAHHFLANGHSVLSENLEICIGQQREMNVKLLREGGVRRRAVTADAKDNRVARVQLWPINLIGFEFAASSLCECEYVKDEDDVLLSSKIAKSDLFPVIAEQREVRCFVPRPQRLSGGSLGECR